MWTAAWIALAAVATLMTLVWVIHIPLRDASIIDPVWGLGFVLCAWIYHGVAPAEGERALLVPLLVTVWGGRLFLYLLWRKWGEPEDYRYREMREARGDFFWWQSLIRVFLLQAVLLWAISLPLLAAQLGPSGPLGWIDGVAVAVWTVGFLFEAVGDWQLARFKANPENRGRVLDSGLWRYTRHPNYFGDAVVWWGYYLLVVAAGVHLWTVYAPVVMTFFLMKVSGVALLEKRLEETKPRYREYRRRTNAFVPWFPKPSGADDE